MRKGYIKFEVEFCPINCRWCEWHDNGKDFECTFTGKKYEHKYLEDNDISFPDECPLECLEELKK